MTAAPEEPAAALGLRNPGFELGNRGRRTRHMILEAARDRFHCLGYEDTTIDMIAAHGGISRATVYTYFASKREVFLAISAETNREYQARIEQFTRVPAGRGMHDALEAWVGDYLHFLDRTYWVTMMWDHVAASDEELLATGIAQQQRAWTAFGSHLLSLRPRSSEQNPTTLGMVAVSMLDRAWFYAEMGGAPTSRDDLHRTLTGSLVALAAA